MKQRLTIEDLANQITELSKVFLNGFRFFEGKMNSFELNLSSLRQDLKQDIEELAIITAKGFDKAASQEELANGLNSLRSELKGGMQELRSGLTQTIHKEVGRLDRRIDQVTYKPRWQK